MKPHVNQVTVLKNAYIFDGRSSSLSELSTVVVEDGRIRDVGFGDSSSSFGEVVDCGGRVLMPGLIDAHFHTYSSSFDVAKLNRMPMSLLSQYAASILEGALQRGFTTVRDPAGSDYGLWYAIESGLIAGPRLFYSGKALTQTGGHGDMRPSDDNTEPCGCGQYHYCGVLSRVADGVDAVRQAARDELRKGAHQLKIFLSGGIASPTDPIWMPQFTDEEVRAVVEEAQSRRTYVCAHTHTDLGARRCVENGVRSIEHGTQISRETARLIRDAGAFVVPTMVVMEVLNQHGPTLGLPDSSLEKISGVLDQSRESCRICIEEDVSLGFGTDLLGMEYHPLQGREFTLRGEISPAVEVLRSATSVNAELMQRSDELGCIKEGAFADIILVDGNPLENLSLLEDGQANIPWVMKAGKVYKNNI